MFNKITKNLSENTDKIIITNSLTLDDNIFYRKSYTFHQKDKKVELQFHKIHIWASNFL